MPDAYDHISLMCRLKAAQTRNKELESGEHYIKLKELHQKECRTYERKIQALLTEIADAHKETIHVRNYWFQVLEDMLQEFEAMQKKADQKLREMEEQGGWTSFLSARRRFFSDDSEYTRVSLRCVPSGSSGGREDGINWNECGMRRWTPSSSA